MGLFGPSREELVGMLAEAIKKSIVRLDPEKRYLILVPPDMREEEVEAFGLMLEEVLSLSDSNVRVVVTSTDVKILEF